MEIPQDLKDSLVSQVPFSFEERLHLESLCNQFEQSIGTKQEISIANYLQTCSGSSRFKAYLVYELVRLALDLNRPDVPRNFLESNNEHFTVEVARACRHFGNPQLTTLVYSGPCRVEVEDFPEVERFRCLQHIGSGGMGHVYEVLDLERNMHVALKTLHSLSGRTLTQFKKEFRALVSISHPNLVRFYEFFQHEQHWFFTMEFVEGLDILNYCRQSEQADIERVLACLSQLADGLNHLHSEGKLHCDLKPSHLLINEEGLLKIMDFGLVLELNDEDLKPASARSALVGTPAYMSPEQMTSQCLSPASDWFSVGIILFELLTGTRPSHHLDRDTLSTDIPDDLVELSLKLITPTPEERPSQEVIMRVFQNTAPRDSRCFPEIFTGRRPFLEKLHQLAQNISKPHGCLVLVSGYSGEGKSSLVRQFLNETESSVILSSRCYNQESVQYPGIDGLADALADHLRSLTQKEIHALAPKDTALLIRLFPGLGRVAWPENKLVAIDDLESRDPRILRERALASLIELFDCLANRTSLVLFIDDFQWAGNDSRALIEVFVKKLPTCLLILSCRREHPEFQTLLTLSDSLKETSHFEHLALTPFSERETQDLSKIVCEQQNVEIPSNSVIARLHKESGGHVYLLNELIRKSVSDSPTNGREDSLVDVLSEKIANLPNNSRVILEFVALSVVPLDAHTTYRLAMIEHLDPSLIRRLEEEKLVVASRNDLGAQLHPYHDAVRSTVEERCKLSVRKEHHRTLATYLETTVNPTGAQAIAFHFEEAGDLEKAARHYLDAGEEALTSLAFERAAEYFRKTLAIGSYTDVEKIRQIRLKISEALEGAGHSFEAAIELETIGTKVTSSEKQQYTTRAAMLYCSSGHLHQGMTLLEELLKNRGYQTSYRPDFLAKLRHVGLQILVLLRTPWIYRQKKEDHRNTEQTDFLFHCTAGLSMVNPYTAAHLLLEAAHLSLKSRESRSQMRALGLNAMYQSAIHPLFDRCTVKTDHYLTQLFSENQDPYMKGFFLMTRGMKIEHRCHFKEATPLLQKAETLFLNKCRRVWWELAMTRACLMWNHCYRAMFRELAPMLHNYLEDAKKRDDQFMTSTIGAYPHPVLLLSQNQPQEARRVSEEAINNWEQGRGFHIQHLTYLMARVFIDLYEGKKEVACEFYESNWDLLSNSDVFTFDFLAGWSIDARITALLAAASILTGGERTRLLKIIQKQIKILQKVRMSPMKALATRHQGVLWHLVGQKAKALKCLSKASPELRKLGLESHALSVEHLIAEIQGVEPSIELVKRFQDCDIQNPLLWRRIQLGI